jgi:hypothetical protein
MPLQSLKRYQVPLHLEATTINKSLSSCKYTALVTPFNLIDMLIRRFCEEAQKIDFR